MSIKALKIQNFRNLSSVDCEFSSGINIIHGENGSGKTSLLEAIYYLGLNRSFRSHINSRIIKNGQDKLSLFAEIAEHKLGLERSLKTSAKIRLNGEDVKSLVQTAEILPLQLIDSQTYQLVDGGPEYRRQFVDWGVFHVEHVFVKDWRRFQRVLKQRNAAIRERLPKKQIQLWDGDFVSLSNQINQHRKDYFSHFLPIFHEVFGKLLSIDGLKLQYIPGWNEGEDLAQVLDEGFVSDFKFGYTLRGPHRADIKITVSGVPAKDALSRGQQKILVSAMRIAQAMLLKQGNNKRAIVLVDDLPAELDATRRKALCGMLKALETQVFITCIESETLETCFPGESLRVFHVEHGRVKD